MPDFPQPHRDPLPARTRFQDGLYCLEEVVGQGNFSLIYAARQGALELPVAVKEFFPKGCRRDKLQVVPAPPWDRKSYEESLQAFLTEGSILGKFNHPGIVRLITAFKANGTAYLVEELLEGHTLKEALQLSGPMPLEQVLPIAAQLGEAVLEVHAAGLVHADLKPENIFSTHRGQQVLLDFSTARSYHDHDVWRTNLATVSPGYSPLEQYTREQKLTPSADVYAFAATLFALLVGQPPPAAPDRSKGAGLAYKVANLPENIQKALLDALHLHPLRRTSSIGLLLEQLGLPSSGSTPVSIGQFTRRSQNFAHPGGVYALALRSPSSQTGGVLCSGGRDGCFRIWSWPELELVRPQKVVSSPVKSLSLSRSGLHLLSGAHDGSIRLWTTREVADGPWLSRDGPAIVNLRFDPRDRFLVAGLADGTCRILSPDGTFDLKWRAHPGAVHALDISPLGDLLATVGDDATVNLWNLPDATPADQLDLPEAANSIRFHPNGLNLLTTARDHAVRLWDLKTRTQINKFVADRADVWDAQFTSDPNLIVTVSADHHLYGFRIDTGQLVLASPVSGGITGAMAVDPNQKRLVIGGSDGQISLWDF